LTVETPQVRSPAGENEESASDALPNPMKTSWLLPTIKYRDGSSSQGPTGQRHQCGWRRSGLRVTIEHLAGCYKAAAAVAVKAADKTISFSSSDITPLPSQE